MLTHHQWGPVAITWGLFHKRCLSQITQITPVRLACLKSFQTWQGHSSGCDFEWVRLWAPHLIKYRWVTASGNALELCLSCTNSSISHNGHKCCLDSLCIPKVNFQVWSSIIIFGFRRIPCDQPLICMFTYIWITSLIMVMSRRVSAQWFFKQLYEIPNLTANFL